MKSLTRASNIPTYVRSLGVLVPIKVHFDVYNASKLAAAHLHQPFHTILAAYIETIHKINQAGYSNSNISNGEAAVMENGIRAVDDEIYD